MTRGEIRSLVRRLLAEQQADVSFWSDADLNDYINQAYTELVSTAELLHCESITDSVEGVPIYAMPVDAIYPIRVWYEGADSPLIRASWQELDKVDSGWLFRVAEIGKAPTHWTVRGQWIHLYPAPNESGRKITVWAVQAPFPMTSDEEEPAISLAYRPALAYLAAVLAIESDRGASMNLPGAMAAVNRLRAHYDRLVALAGRHVVRKHFAASRLVHPRESEVLPWMG